MLLFFHQGKKSKKLASSSTNCQGITCGEIASLSFSFSQLRFFQSKMTWGFVCHENKKPANSPKIYSRQALFFLLSWNKRKEPKKSSRPAGIIKQNIRSRIATQPKPHRWHREVCRKILLRRSQGKRMKHCFCFYNIASRNKSGRLYGASYLMHNFFITIMSILWIFYIFNPVGMKLW